MSNLHQEQLALPYVSDDNDDDGEDVDKDDDDDIYIMMKCVSVCNEK